MPENKHEALKLELNLVSEYAGLPLVFEVHPAPEEKQSLVHLRGREEPFLVHTTWCIGNTKRLPDKATNQQMLHSLTVSHPKIKGVSEKHTG